MNVHIFKAKRAVLIVAAVLIILLFYTAISKLLDVEAFERQLANQTLPKWSTPTLLWLIPLSELLVCGLLMTDATRRMGLYGSAILMVLFTTYMGLVLLNVFDKVPCSCGGVISTMDFKTHFLFNLFFLTLSVVGVYMFNNKKKGGPVAASD